MKLFNPFKKAIILAALGTGISFFWASGLMAQTGDDYLRQIAENTKGILLQVDKLPTYFEKIVASSISWLATDDTEETAKMQASFNSLGTLAANNFNMQANLQPQLSADIVGLPLSDFAAAQGKVAKIKETLPQINNIMYGSMIGKVPAPSLPFSAMDYVKNAGAANISHPVPRDNWQGDDGSKLAYKNYYNLVIAVESFSNYVLSNLAAENQSGNQVTAMQNDLISKATDSGWILKVTTEELGKVLRQILIFQSQSYVLQMQSLQVQKQLLTATAMTNSLLIANNRVNESIMLSKARGVNA